jgi:hypothetical protein
MRVDRERKRIAARCCQIIVGDFILWNTLFIQCKEREHWPCTKRPKILEQGSFLRPRGRVPVLSPITHF